MDSENEYNKISKTEELNRSRINVSVFWFPSLNNIREIIKLKLVYKSKIFYVLHEPFDSIRNYYKSGFGLVKIIKICLINLVNIPTILLSDKIILPSESALKTYEKNYSWINKEFTMIPLLFTDENNKEVSPKKTHISYIGTIAADHAFNKFIDFAIIAMENDWFPGHKFLIATSSRIPSRERKLVKSFIEKGLIEVKEGEMMSNKTINGFYQNSAIVWNAYNRSMQSGVLPKAYMFGAAVIVLFKNNSIFIDDHETGILVNDNGNVEELRVAVEKILSEKQFFETKSRNKFLSTFFYKKYLDDFKNLLKDS
jgi:hypothetical protein